MAALGLASVSAPSRVSVVLLPLRVNVRGLPLVMMTLPVRSELPVTVTLLMVTAEPPRSMSHPLLLSVSKLMEVIPAPLVLVLLPGPVKVRLLPLAGATSQFPAVLHRPSSLPSQVTANAGDTASRALPARSGKWRRNAVVFME